MPGTFCLRSGEFPRDDVRAPKAERPPRSWRVGRVGKEFFFVLRREYTSLYLWYMYCMILTSLFVIYCELEKGRFLTRTTIWLRCINQLIASDSQYKLLLRQNLIILLIFLCIRNKIQSIHIPSEHKHLPQRSLCHCHQGRSSSLPMVYSASITPPKNTPT